MKIIYVLMILVGTASVSFWEIDKKETIDSAQEARIDTFTFSSGTLDINGKIYLPASFSKDKNFHAIYLIDFTEQHFKVAKDEFKKVISATEEIQGLDAVVVTLEEHIDVDASPSIFRKYFNIYKNMALYVDSNYTKNATRTFIGRGSEAGLVLMTLFLEDPATSIFENFIATDSPGNFNSYIIDMINGGNYFPENKHNKKLHFSFSRTNDYTSCTSTINAINNAEYPWLQFESLQYMSDYENTYPAAFAAGLKYIFNDLQTSVEEDLSTVPREYQLEQNYPNPFNPSTTISYSIKESGLVSLEVYNMLGQKIINLIKEYKEAGNHQVKFDAVDFGSGVYFYKLEAKDFVETKKMVLMK